MAKQQNITIGGKTYPVTFTLQTIINFEETAKKSYFGLEYMTTLDRVALIYAAVTTAAPDADIKIDAIIGKLDLEAAKEIMTNYATVNALAAEFFDVPAVMKEEEKTGKTEEPEADNDTKN